MPSKSKSSEIKKRPPRLYYDKATDRYYIYMGKKKVWYKKGEDPKKIRKQLLTKVRTDNVGTRRNKAVNVKVNVVNNIKGPSRRTGQSKAKVTTGFSNMQYMEQQRVLELARLRSALSSATESQRKAELAANQVVVKPADAPVVKKEKTVKKEKPKKKEIANKAKELAVPLVAAATERAIKESDDDLEKIAELRHEATLLNRKAKTEAEFKIVAEKRAQADEMTKKVKDLEKKYVTEAKEKAFARATKFYDGDGTADDDEREEAKEEKKVKLPTVINLMKSGPVVVGKDPNDSKDSDDDLEIVDKSNKGFIGTMVDAGKKIFSPKKGKGKETGANGEPLPKQVARVGLYSDQIARMMSRYVDDGFLGVVAADEVDELGPKSSRYDKFGFIMNKDTSDKPGSHWVAVYVDTIDDKSVEYFDSFAEEPDEVFLREVKGLIQAHKLPIYLKMKINKIKHQAENSNLCGFHAMKFLMDRFAGKPFVEASGWSEVRKGEAGAKKLMDNMSGKGTKFGYI